jgi:hypothetical protein
MRWIMRAAGPLALSISMGCGSGPPSTSNPGDPPPHGGVSISMPGGTGLVEIVKKDSSASKQSITSEVSFYFFKNGYTPYSPNPSGGTLTLASGKKVELKPEGDALVTPPGPALFKQGDVDGTLTVQLDGVNKTIPLGVR